MVIGYLITCSNVIGVAYFSKDFYPEKLAIEGAVLFIETTSVSLHQMFFIFLSLR